MIKHRYAHEIDPNGGSAAAVLARMVEPGQRVLELGTGPGTVTRILHDKGCKVTGVEMDSDTPLAHPFVSAPCLPIWKTHFGGSPLATKNLTL
jgi:hypothetical protein